MSEQLDFLKFFRKLICHNNKLAIGKMALILSMCDNDFDDAIVSEMEKQGVKAVITRAGGRGDNFKNKILRNSLSAAEKSGVIKANLANRYALIRCVENSIYNLEGVLSNVSGAGIKIGIVSMGKHLAMGVYGTIGIPGIEVDQEVIGGSTQFYSIDNR